MESRGGLRVSRAGLLGSWLPKLLKQQVVELGAVVERNVESNVERNVESNVESHVEGIVP